MATPRAYGPGSSEPARTPSTLRIYSMRFCPFAQRSLLVLHAKNIPHEIVNINLSTKPEWYVKKISTGKVPLLETEGVLLPESAVIAEYLDDVYPGRKLISQDPYQKALDKVFVESFSFMPIFKAYANKEDCKASFDGFFENTKVLDAELTNRETKFLGGNDHPGFADMMVWPFFNIAIAYSKIDSALTIPSDTVPRVAKWIDDMLTTDEVKKLVDLDQMAAYVQSRFDGAIDYDAGINRPRCPA